MAQKQKRPSPLDDPPTASSSDSEEDHIPSSQQHDEEEEEEEDASSEEQEEDDDDEEEIKGQPSSKNPPPVPTNPNPKRASSDSETETDSGSDSDSDPPPPTSNSKLKPLASKPIDQTPKPKSQPSTSATAKSASKRPVENNGHVSDPKRAKKKGTESAAAGSDEEAEEEDVKKSGDDSKKMFQRLWSEEDEIAILKGMVEFTSKTGNDPFKFANEFHDFMKKSLHVEASSNQLKQKIRRLKKKYETNAARKGKNGQGPTFSKPHDQKAFELSKKIWASEVDEGGPEKEKAKSNGKAAKNTKNEGSSSRNVAPSKARPKPESKPELRLVVSKEAEKMDIDEKMDTTTSHLMEVIRLDKGVGLYGLNEDVVKGGMGLIGASKRAELEGQWKELQVAELELYVKRAELVANQAKLILEAYKSSNH